MPKHIRKKSISNARRIGSMAKAESKGGKGDMEKAPVVVADRVRPFLSKAMKITQ